MSNPPSQAPLMGSENIKSSRKRSLEIDDKEKDEQIIPTAATVKSLTPLPAKTAPPTITAPNSTTAAPHFPQIRASVCPPLPSDVISVIIDFVPYVFVPPYSGSYTPPTPAIIDFKTLHLSAQINRAFWCHAKNKRKWILNYKARNTALHKRVREWVLNPNLAITKYGHISRWNVSNVTSMRELFNHQITFNEDISTWDVSNVTDMSFMFFNAQAFTGSLSSWDVSKVKTMRLMFASTKYNLSISNFNLESCENISGMFRGNKSFNVDISKWNVSKVHSLQAMFKNATAFNQDISEWDVRNVEDCGECFLGAERFDRRWVNDWVLKRGRGVPKKGVPGSAFIGHGVGLGL